MKRKLVGSGLLAGALVGMFVWATIALTAPPQAGDGQFEKAVIFLEFNATDEDIGVHIDTDHDIGLRELRIVAPNGRTVVDQDWVTRPPLGLTEMATESAEPDVTRALRAYPPGTYRFFGVTVEGRRLSSRARLSHDLLDAPQITNPPNGATVPTKDLVVTWNPVPEARGYVLEFEGEDGKILEAFLDESSDSFEIPEGLLEPDADYKVGVAVIAVNGNLSLSSIEFHTD